MVIEPRTSRISSNRSAIWATATAPFGKNVIGTRICSHGRLTWFFFGAGHRPSLTGLTQFFLSIWFLLNNLGVKELKSGMKSILLSLEAISQQQHNSSSYWVLFTLLTFIFSKLVQYTLLVNIWFEHFNGHGLVFDANLGVDVLRNNCLNLRRQCSLSPFLIGILRTSAT